ncbi:MAG: 5-dehydro-2-deoxygluconokinase [Sphingomonas sp.]|nr:5-dehydro-2-deoxygluconokinase [Sphingomonas sp.]
MGESPQLELLTIGRSCVDLYGEQAGGRLEDMGSFAKYVGGSPTNTAVGAARLGLGAGLLTRVGADHMGRFIREQLQREGVDVSGVIDDPARLTALVILGIRDKDSFPLIFYRENCADMALEPADLAAIPALPRAVLINGTHLSQPNVRALSVAAAERVRANGGRVVFDVDYRPVLWGLERRDMGENRFVADDAVTARLQEILPLCDLIVGTEEEIHILGGSTDTLAALREIRARTGALIVCKRGPLGCVAFDGAIPEEIGQGIQAPGFPVEVFNVLGAGDAFMAGFLRGWLRGAPIATCCTYGNACGAIVVSRHGCAPAMPTWPELEHFLAMRERPFRLREDKALEHIHWATTRNPDYDELTVLAIDHRAQFEDLADEVGVNDSSRIGVFKALALGAVDRVAKGDPCFGILLDGKYGADALAAAAGHPYWIGRPIEEPRSRPLAFEDVEDVGSEIATWPLAHVVKCLVFYHPEDSEELRAAQEARLLTLFEACRRTRHELLVEVIAPHGSPVDCLTIATVIRRLYEIGVYPDWWKLEPDQDPAAWRNIEAAILENDPLCRGVVLLGLSAPMPDLVASFRAAAPVGIIKGFAVGRTIFYDVARDWLSGTIDDDGAMTEMAGRLTALAHAWREAKAGVEKAA